ncbi:hypothetical protein pdul_cds_996 [Pandoravirus dulcis]|uniref:Uncharacterized protein n=1 Tax=Pandoravirus dulcis TaxID=1349409 RepID=S4VS80_9VIRU|nr:hypothetical protein pdul_cds_996 [Pandoravirus dulcis]AGO83258.1 hypothetical protein pdul_cds_996 [Pandoravirus dulcis]
MAAVMLDRVGLGVVATMGDPRDARFEDATQYVRVGGRLYASVDRAIAIVLSHADDASGRQRGVPDDDPAVRAAWWLYQARVAQRLCATDLDPGEVVEREDPLGVTVRPCGPIAEVRRAAHARSLAYSAAGLVRLFDRMQHVWGGRAFGPDLAWVARAGGPLERVVARLALASRAASLARRRARRKRRMGHPMLCRSTASDGPCGSHSDRAPHGGAPVATTTQPSPTVPWPVAHMSIEFMNRLQCVINRRPPMPRDAPLTPPLADQPDSWTPMDG